MRAKRRLSIGVGRAVGSTAIARLLWNHVGDAAASQRRRRRRASSALSFSHQVNKFQDLCFEQKRERRKSKIVPDC